MPVRELLPQLLAFDWSAVVVALIGMFGSVLSAGIGGFVVWQLRTPSGARIGKQVEDAQHVALANAYAIQRLQNHVGMTPDPVPAPLALAEPEPEPETGRPA